MRSPPCWWVRHCHLQPGARGLWDSLREPEGEPWDPKSGESKEEQYQDQETPSSLEEQSPVTPRTPKWGAQRGRSTAIGRTLNSLEGGGDSLDREAENKGRRDPKTISGTP